MSVTGEVVVGDVELGQSGLKGSEKFPLTGSSKKTSQITLDWVNLSYKTDGEKGAEPKTLLHPMSGRAAPGEMVAIMGTSGAGKSTLLDILAGRLHNAKGLSGSILTNGKPINRATFRRQSGYVMQSDALFPLLTVKETLHYAAHLRVEGTYAQREEVAEATLKLLRLDHVQNTIVGDDLNRGLSGGEKRRVSIAVDIIHQPTVIFLDEPTSGLDSTTALTVVDVLRNIANNRGSTIIVTIHQPSAKIYSLFNKCIFLSNGNVTFSGPAADLQEHALQLYKKADLGAPPISNAPEVFLELCDELKSSGKIDLAIVDTTAGGDLTNNGDGSSFDDDEATVNHVNNYFYETHLILSRNLTNIVRTKELFFARIGASAVFGIMIGSLFYQVPRTVEGVTERVAYLVFAIAFFLYTSLEALPIFLAEREIFQREYSRGAYRAISYVTAVTCVYLPFLFVLGLLFAVASWWLVGMPEIAETFWFYVFTLLCTNAAGQSFAVLLSVLVPDPMAGQSGGSGLLSVMFLFSGFFIKASRIPRWWKWLHYLSLFKYSYDSSVINALQHHIVTLDGLNNYEVLQYVSVDGVSKWRGVGVLIAFTIFFRICFYYVLITSYNGSRKK